MKNYFFKISATFLFINFVLLNFKIAAQSSVIDLGKTKFKIVGMQKNEVNIKKEKRRKIKVSIENFYLQINIPGIQQGKELTWMEVKESQSTDIISDFLSYIEHNNIGFAIGLTPPEENRMGNNSRARKINYLHNEKGIIFNPYIWKNGELERIEPSGYPKKIVFKAYVGDIIPLKLYVYSYKTHTLKFDPMAGYDEKLIEVKELTRLNLPIEDAGNFKIYVKFYGKNWNLDYDYE